MTDDPLHDFHWCAQPEAAGLVHGALAAQLALAPGARRLAARLERETGIRLSDLLARLALPSPGDHTTALRAAGFQPADGAWRHMAGRFPALVDGGTPALVVRVDQQTAFRAAQGAKSTTDAELVPRWTVSDAWDGGSAATPAAAEPAVVAAFAARPRGDPDTVAAQAALLALVDEAVASVGRDRACELFFAAERGYWQARCPAGQAQKSRQDALGIGWANHDHHTFRSSRPAFTGLIAVLEHLGLRCRERFYPGGHAGWGAQVLEHPGTGIVVFADVDMSADELRLDFAHQPFADGEAARPLGTVGLWCALHGESLFQAGLHHLACLVDFDLARRQLEAAGVVSMAPFTDFPFLRQCFTSGGTWTVDGARVERLARSGLITAAQAAQFAAHGALGAHLELIERNQGFRGFNQTGVDAIIGATDPRRAVG